VPPDYLDCLPPAAPGAPRLTPHARASAVDWMIDGAWQLGVSSDALFLGVALLDRYLAARGPAPEGCMPLAAATCLWVASK
jgi:hypothetical protein